MSNPADYLSDSDAERMSRIFDTGLWAYIDSCRETQPDFFAMSYSAQLDRVRRAWSSRPESARAIDRAALASVGKTFSAADMNTIDAATTARGRELLKASGGNSDEPYDNKSPTGGAA